MGRFIDTGLRVAALAGILGLAAKPAFALVAIPIPEPSTLSLVGAGIVGVAVAVRMWRRK